MPRKPRQPKFSLGWIALLVVALLAAAPIISVVLGAAAGDWGGELMRAGGARYLSTTLVLCGLAGAGAGLIGAGAALLIALTEFPGRRILSVALALPFAIPAYVAAYTYGDLFSPFGPLASMFGAQGLPEIRTLPGAAFILMLTTYPYVYLAMTASLSARSSALMEAARMLGASPMRASLGLIATASRPAFFGGLALALMEIAADYGVADYFGVPTLSVGIFRTWYGLGDLQGAMQLAAGLFFVALLLVLMESASRAGRSSEDARSQRAGRRLALSPGRSVLAILACLVPVTFGFLAPAGVLLSKLNLNMSASVMERLVTAGLNTAAVATSGAAIAIALALVLSYAARSSRGMPTRVLLRAATLGYAVPGAVMAIGVLALTSGMARASGHAIAGGVLVLLYAYVARFLTAGFNSTAGGLAQVNPQLDGAAHMLGADSRRIIARLHWPLARNAVLAGAAIVAIDIAKELPATLILRPFNFETLSTQIYRLASDERLADAAPAALTLIALGLLPSIALSWIANSQEKTRKREALAGLESAVSA